MNKSCYRFQKITFSNGLLQNCVDATYVIHLENNGRYENIITQLDKFPITKMNFILLNKGYLNCKKDEYIDTPPKDLVDSYLTIFKHANQQKYGNILILEDDYFFNEEIKKKSVRYEIFQFINKHKEENFIYLLGCFPFFIYPTSFNSNHYRGISAGMHACIYSKKCRIEILKLNKKKIKDWDIYFNMQFKCYKYIYYKPLCYQLFPETENSKHWGDYNLCMYYGSIMAKKGIKYIKLDTQAEPGYSKLYFLSKYILLINFIIIFLLLILFFILFKYK